MWCKYAFEYFQVLQAAEEHPEDIAYSIGPFTMGYQTPFWQTLNAFTNPDSLPLADDLDTMEDGPGCAGEFQFQSEGATSKRARSGSQFQVSAKTDDVAEGVEGPMQGVFVFQVCRARMNFVVPHLAPSVSGKQRMLLSMVEVYSSDSSQPHLATLHGAFEAANGAASSELQILTDSTLGRDEWRNLRRWQVLPGLIYKLQLEMPMLMASQSVSQEVLKGIYRTRTIGTVVDDYTIAPGDPDNEVKITILEGLQEQSAPLVSNS